MNPLFDIEEHNKVQDSHGIWAEKYRPKNMIEFIGSETVKQAAEAAIKKGEIPHLLLKGIQGTGKTSLGKLLVRYIPCDYLYINASNENSVDDVRNKIMNFVTAASFQPIKIVFLDESDKLSPEAQSALRHIMEEQSVNNRFILTCNYSEKILPAIVSRCQVFEIKPLSKSELASRLAYILRNENIKFDPKNVAFIVNTYYPDFRRMINFAQQSSISGVLVINNDTSIDNDMKEKLVSLLKSPCKTGTFASIRQLVADANFSAYDEVYKYLYDHISEFAGGKEADVILELAESMYQSALVFEKEITFVAAMHRLLKVLNK